MSGETLTVVSYNRPLTRSARKDLKKFGIVEIESINEFGHWTEIELEERPPDDILDRHELKLDREPDRIFETENGEVVEIYDDQVLVDGYEQNIPPDEAIEYAESNGWEQKN